MSFVSSRPSFGEPPELTTNRAPILVASKQAQSVNEISQIMWLRTMLETVFRTRGCDEASLLKCLFDLAIRAFE